MTFLEKIKNIIFKGRMQFAPSINGYTPIYGQYGQDLVQSSDVVIQAINCIITEMCKLQPTHIKKIENDIVPQKSTIQNILDNPNEIMTQTDFIEKVMWNYYYNSNSFIIPRYYVWEDEGIIKKHYVGLYPVRPAQVDFLQDESDRYFVKFYFANNLQCTLPYNDVIHLRRDYSIDEYMGGGYDGQPNNQALKETLKLNKQLLDSIANNLGASTKVNGILRIKSFINKEALQQELDKFNSLLDNNASGILPLDSTAEYEPMKRNTKIVDTSTLEFVDEKILRTFGIPLCILKGDYTKEQYEAFYQKTLEPLVLKISQAFTKTLFTQREKSFGNGIMFYPKELVFMNTSQTLELVRLLGDSGAMYENEKRVAFGLKPLAELEGVRMQSLNYVDVKNASKYQTGQEDSDSNDSSDNNNDEDDDNDNENEDKTSNNDKRSEDMSNKLERKYDYDLRSFDFEIRAVEDEEKGAEIEGRPIVYRDKYDVCGVFGETIDDGALDKCDLKDVRLLVNHNTDMVPLARSRNNNENSTMQLKVDKDGMTFRATLDTEHNNDAKTLYSAIKRGDITGMSFMFKVSGENWENKDSKYPIRHITGISKVYEVSAVTFPAYENTSIQARAKQTLDNVCGSEALDNAKRSLDNEKSKLEFEKLRAIALNKIRNYGG